MIKTAGFAIILLLSFNCIAQTGSEIYLFDLTLKKDKILLSNAKNISNNTGYDNQPFFHPDNTLVYYTSADTSGRTDIVVYDYNRNETKKFTNTNEREYSPTVTPDKKYISCIIQRDDGAQDLGKYPIDGGEPVVIINTLKVGYHAWADNETLILFVLGEPHSLHWFSIADNKDSVLAENIGRSLHVIPTTGDLSFIQKGSAEKWLIRKLEEQTKKISNLAETLPGKEDLAWTTDGRIVMSDGQKLFYLQPGKDKSWNELEVESSLPLKGITRISVNKKGDKMAVVISE